MINSQKGDQVSFGFTVNYRYKEGIVTVAGIFKFTADVSAFYVEELNIAK